MKSDKFPSPLACLILAVAAAAAVRIIWNQLPASATGATPTALTQPVQLAISALFIAFLTSAVLQIWKELGDLRLEVHRQALDDWLFQRLRLGHPVLSSRKTPLEYPLFAADFTAAPPKKTSDFAWEWVNFEVSAPEARDEIERLCAAESHLPVFYNLPTRQWCGQIARCVDLVLVSPHSHPNIFAALVSGNDQSHVSVVRDFLHANDRKSGASKSAWEKEHTSPHSEEIASPGEEDHVRITVTNHAERALDGLQSLATRQWKRRLLCSGALISVFISLTVAVIIAYPTNQTIAGWLGFFYTAILCGTTGTLLTPLAYDITSAIRGFGRQ